MICAPCTVTDCHAHGWYGGLCDTHRHEALERVTVKFRCHAAFQEGRNGVHAHHEYRRKLSVKALAVLWNGWESQDGDSGGE